MLEYLVFLADVVWHDRGLVLHLGDIEFMKHGDHLYSYRNPNSPYSRWELVTSPVVQGLAKYDNFCLVRTMNKTWRYDDEQRKLVPCTIVNL